MLHGMLAEEKNKLTLFVGVGNILRSDDGAGVYISGNIMERKKIRTLTVEVSIENYISKINAYKAGRIIIIDCVHLNKPPGSWQLIRANKLSDLTANTHNISLKKITEFFTADVFILGIQPENLNFGETLSPAVKKSADEIIRTINSEAD